MDLQTINTFFVKWKSLTEDQRKPIERIKSSVQSIVEKENESDINRGQYDCFVSVQSIINGVVTKNLGEIQTLLRSVDYPLSDISTSNEIYLLIVNQCLQELIQDGILLYVYDKQRVRSRIAEVVRYFSYLKQRMDEDYDQSPGLTHMVKLHIKNRQRPKRSIKLHSALIDISKQKQYVTLHESLKSIINTSDSYNTAFVDLQRMVEFYFGKKQDKIELSKFQVEGFKHLFRAALSKEFNSKNRSFIIQSSTGSGKTEAFLFPILVYTLLMRGKKGTKALLLYPRIDLCNDQLQRLVRLVLEVNTHEENRSKTIKIGIDHGQRDSITLACPYPGCTGHVHLNKDNPSNICDCDRKHKLDFIVQKRDPADIIITTPDSLHRRLMDKHGKSAIWDDKATWPKFVVFDEAHIYTNQTGMHVANIIRRLRHKITEKGSTEPIFIASSATIGAPERFAQNLFSTDEAVVIRPQPEDLEEIGREYVIFIKATNPRRITIRRPSDHNQESLDDDSGEIERVTIATNLSAMIQTAFCFYHAMLKIHGKDRIIGFVDSIDIIKRIGDKLCDAEENRQLYRLRLPDQKLNIHENPQCPHIPCNTLPPNPYINRCQRYLDGECWWVMGEGDEDPMTIHMHKSGTTCDCRNVSARTDDWDMMITTSALEVGFDHPAVIGTFQYMAPMNIPGFVQRIGRGGRSPTDMPVAVVVLGARPLDNFYFHHTVLLTNPDPDKLEIPIDPENAYVKAMHIASFIYDYISTIGQKQDVQTNYYDLDISETVRIIDNNREHLLDSICRAFEISPTNARSILDNLLAYYLSWMEEVDLPTDNDHLINKVRFIKNQSTIEQIQRDILQTIVRLGGSI